MLDDEATEVRFEDSISEVELLSDDWEAELEEELGLKSGIEMPAAARIEITIIAANDVKISW